MTDQLLQQITDCAINPALKLLPEKMDSQEARVMMLAIGLQESRLTYRVQVSPNMPSMKGPARGLWQFERGGGCVGVLTHKATREYAKKICAALDVPADSGSVWAELEHNDILAAAFARLLLYSDPQPLPALTDSMAGWRLYALRTWRPGSPHPETWPGFWQRAVKFVTVA